MNKSKFDETVIIATGPDALTFRKTFHLATDLCYEADLPISLPFEHLVYQVYQWKDGWALHRPEIVRLAGVDSLSSWVAELEKAFELCAADYEVVARLFRWQNYFRTHEPPPGEGRT